MIKPNAVKQGNIGPILNKISEGNFKIKAMKLTHLSMEQAERFYSIHSERPFFKNLCEFMSSGPIVAAILEKENAVQGYRDYIGPTNPENAPDDSIRGLFGTSLQMNAVHGSDSDENAKTEACFFFNDLEIFTV
jgi:nucleoside-diphosphate kinase